MSNGTTTWNYTYNADGLRTKRTNGTDTYTYVYNGNQLVQMTVDSYTLYFAYDAAGVPLTVTVNGYIYYYITNLQGDVIGIKDSSGQQFITYSYDAWGKLLYRTNTPLADYNPLRYRGYVYDFETGLYYLQSRYYDPEMGRFINGDGLVAIGQGFTGNNMFAYCLNNPVIGCDPCGTCFHRLDFWNDCNKCKDKSFSEKVDAVIPEAKKFISKSGEVIKAVFNNIEFSIGIGYGLYGETTIADIWGIGFGAAGNLAELQLDDGDFSVVQTAAIGLQVSFLFMDVFQNANENSTRDYYNDHDAEWIEDEYNKNWTIFSAAVYFFGGGSIYIGFDIISFFEDIDSILFYE